MTTPADRDQIIADAKSLPDLIAKAQAADPDLAAQLIPKSLVYSKTPYGTLIVSGVSWLAAKYGLACAAGAVATNCWTPDTVNLVAGFAAMAGAFIGSAIMRYIIKSPIGGILKAK
jgi:hypothetical protein